MNNAKDAARYRWLREQFVPDGHDDEWLEAKGQNEQGQVIAERRTAWNYCYHLYREERFGGTARSEAEQKSLDAILDELMATSSETP